MNPSMESLDHVKLNFSPSGLLFLNIALAFIMFGVALDIKFSDFIDVVKRPKSVITGMMSQFLLLPFFTFLLVLILDPAPTIALGMILVSTCPGGNISNFISSMAKADTALSVSLTAIATIYAIFITPMNFALWGDFYIRYYNHSAAALLRPLEIDQWQMFETVFILLGIPVIVGLLFAYRFPGITGKIRKPLRVGSVVFFIMMVVILLWSNFSHFLKYVHLVFFIVLIHNALALGVGYLFSTITRRPIPDRRTIAIETGIQNSGLALALIFNPKIFPPNLALGGMAVVAAWWGVWHIVSGLALATFWGNKTVLA
ncbi:bile acid:sodium symporter family protein [Gaoshiqia sp. Z1-71]|uniref:bile acid:sodium symporter family protein n=1 Tax=Gaoshiqia hydrogeniformans TaxID=3290090 RepID=UPI003BF8BE9B